MKLLLTSAGIKNTSIHDALVDLLGKPIAESCALCIPTRRSCSPPNTEMVSGFARDLWLLWLKLGGSEEVIAHYA